MDQNKDKPIHEKIKEMIDYDDSFFENNGEGFSELLKKLDRNKSYVRYVLYIAHSSLVKGLHVSIRDISKAIEKDVGYVQKITDIFLNQDLLIKIKSHRKNIYTLHMDDEPLRCFMQLFQRAKLIKDEDKKIK